MIVGTVNYSAFAAGTIFIKASTTLLPAIDTLKSDYN